MHQLFANLIGNSLKFSKDKPLIKISTTMVNGDAIPGAINFDIEQKFCYLCFSDNDFIPRLTTRYSSCFKGFIAKMNTLAPA